jgi:hypothetical protein
MLEKSRGVIFDRTLVDIFNGAAGTTDEMVVMGPVGDQFIMCMLVFHIHTTNDPRISKRFETPIGCRLICLFTDTTNQLGGRDRTFRVVQERQQGDARIRHPEPMSSQNGSEFIRSIH